MVPLVEGRRRRMDSGPFERTRGSDFDLMLERAESVNSETDSDWEECEAERSEGRRGRPARQPAEPGDWGWEHFAVPRKLPKGLPEGGAEGWGEM